MGDGVNLERSLLPSDRLGGHFVLGHVDGVARIERVEKLGSSRMVWIRVRKAQARWLIPVGSVAVDGISLTVARVRAASFGVAIIPHTTEITGAVDWKPGGRVNVEFDVIGKYVEKLMGRGRRRRKSRPVNRKS
jgi:riboflavin synthase